MQFLQTFYFLTNICHTLLIIVQQCVANIINLLSVLLVMNGYIFEKYFHNGAAIMAW